MRFSVPLYINNHMNYQKGKIYKVLNTVNDQLYVGSTCSPLSKRMAQHRKQALTGTDLLSKHMRAVGNDFFYIELVEEFPCSNKDQLAAKEHVLARQLGATLNFLGKQNHKHDAKTISPTHTPQHYNISEDGDVQEEHADDIPTHKLYFSDLDGFNMISSFVSEATVTCIRDHYDSVIALKRYLQHYPEDRYNKGKLKDEQHKLENAVRKLNGAEANINNVKGPEGIGPLVCQDQLSRFLGHLLEMSMEAPIEAERQENI